MTGLSLTPRYDPQPMQKIQTLWRPPWYVFLAAQQGPNHFAFGEIMEDSHAVGAVDDVTWMIVADGVGAASRSHDASRLACQAADSFLGARLSEDRALSLGLIREAMAAAHDAVAALAAKTGREHHDYQTTLIIALLHGDTVMAGSIGDSSIAISTRHDIDGGKPTTLFTPFCTAPPHWKDGNYSRTLMDADWQDQLAFNALSDPTLHGVWLATDGGRFFVEPTSPDGPEHVFDDTWPNLIESALENLTPLKMAMLFAQFMDEVSPEKKDDRTIIIAYRPTEEHAAPAP